LKYKVLPEPSGQPQLKPDFAEHPESAPDGIDDPLLSL